MFPKEKTLSIVKKWINAPHIRFVIIILLDSLLALLTLYFKNALSASLFSISSSSIEKLLSHDEQQPHTTTRGFNLLHSFL